MPQTTTDSNRPARDWLFKKDGQVFGPVPEAQLAELLVKGRIGSATEVAGDDGVWRPLGEVPGLLVLVKKAEARARVEAEVTDARKLERRRGAFFHGTVFVVALVMLGVFGSGAWWLATRRPWERRSELLEDFGEGITISAVRVGGGPRAVADDEIVIPSAPTPAGRPAHASRHKRPGADGKHHRPGATPAASGDLVAAQYDVRRIQDAVARQKSSLAICLREEARRSPEWSGEIPIEFAVGNDGKVAALWIDEPRFKIGALRDCLYKRLSAWSFDSFAGQRPVVSLSFRIGGGTGR